MCAICGYSKCVSGCPNAPDPIPVSECYDCHEPILPGDEYAHIDGVDYCKSCLEDMGMEELFKLLGMGYAWKRADYDD